MHDQESPPVVSRRRSPFSKPELAYLSKLAAAMQYRVEPETVRMWLEKAQHDVLDPQELYEAAVQQRLPQWAPAPPFKSVLS